MKAHLRIFATALAGVFVFFGQYYQKGISAFVQVTKWLRSALLANFGGVTTADLTRETRPSTREAE